MWYECQWDNSPSKSQFIKVNHYESMYGLQHGALAHTEQQALFHYILSNKDLDWYHSEHFYDDKYKVSTCKSFTKVQSIQKVEIQIRL